MFKFSPSGNVIASLVEQAIRNCRDNIVKKIKQDLGSLLPHLALPAERKLIENVTLLSESCCSTSSKYCCPAGHLVRSTGGTLENVVCCKFRLF